jgi:hypothetical protein
MSASAPIRVALGPARSRRPDRKRRDRQIDRSVLPIRRPPFAGSVTRTLAGSGPDWNILGSPKAPEAAPNVPLVLSTGRARAGGQEPQLSPPSSCPVEALSFALSEWVSTTLRRAGRWLGQHRRISRTVGCTTSTTTSGPKSCGSPRPSMSRREPPHSATSASRQPRPNSGRAGAPASAQRQRARRSRPRPEPRLCPLPQAPDDGLMPQLLVNDRPGSRRMRSCPVRNAFGGQVMGSTARLRRSTSGRTSPVNSIRYG